MRPIVPLLALLGIACRIPQPEEWDHSDEPLYGSGGKVNPGGLSTGDTDAEADDAPGVPDEEFDGALVYFLDGGDFEDCRVHWSVIGEARSTECEYCSFTLDWAYDITYTFSPDLTDVEGDCAYTTAGYYADLGYELAEYLTYGWPVWAYSSDFYGEPRLLLGMTYYGYYGGGEVYFYPLVSAPPPGSADFAFNLFTEYYGYYEYYEAGFLGYGEW